VGWFGVTSGLPALRESASAPAQEILLPPTEEERQTLQDLEALAGDVLAQGRAIRRLFDLAPGSDSSPWRAEGLKLAATPDGGYEAEARYRFPGVTPGEESERLAILRRRAAERDAEVKGYPTPEGSTGLVLRFREGGGE
jgi:hypothetical protein